MTHGTASARGSGLYRRFFAWLMARMAPDHDEKVAEYKRRLMGGLSGLVVEIGPGTGVNLRHLPRGVRYVGVERNEHMFGYFRQEAEKRGREAELRRGWAEALPFESGSVDAVLSTLVLCSVRDVETVLAEVLRVLRPGGRFVFLEHVGAPAGSRLRRWQKAVKPVWRRLGDGCEPDRDLGATIRAAGFDEVRIEAFDADLPLSLVRPHIAGIARKPAARA